ncbi:hypothetical protein E2C01_088607 [Portunus trituberculatus]|uniref:Uncharacterized protein n=1 Tax=Portunus trituberculatus TaxID=210409 RepID=A0A5B7JF44_PORTR|nr:hypothetical protein [Portunus trituberculatus]
MGRGGEGRQPHACRTAAPPDTTQGTHGAAHRGTPSVALPPPAPPQHHHIITPPLYQHTLHRHSAYTWFHTQTLPNPHNSTFPSLCI